MTEIRTQTQYSVMATAGPNCEQPEGTRQSVSGGSTHLGATYERREEARGRGWVDLVIEQRDVITITTDWTPL